MSRYYVQRSRPRAAWWDDVPLLPNINVSDHQPVDTGLVDASGNPIMRAPEPVGFHRPRRTAA